MGRHGGCICRPPIPASKAVAYPLSIHPSWQRVRSAFSRCTATAPRRMWTAGVEAPVGVGVRIRRSKASMARSWRRRRWSWHSWFSAMSSSGLDDMPYAERWDTDRQYPISTRARAPTSLRRGRVGIALSRAARLRTYESNVSAGRPRRWKTAPRCRSRYVVGGGLAQPTLRIGTTTYCHRTCDASSVHWAGQGAICWTPPCGPTSFTAQGPTVAPWAPGPEPGGGAPAFVTQNDGSAPFGTDPSTGRASSSWSTSSPACARCAPPRRGPFRSSG